MNKITDDKRAQRNRELTLIDDLADEMTARCVEIAGTNTPAVKPEDIRFLLRANFNEEDIRSWCMRGAEVDVPFIVRSMRALHDELTINRGGSPLNAPVVVSSRYRQMMESPLDDSLCTVELAFYASLISIGVNHTDMSMNVYQPLSFLYGVYSDLDVLALYDSGATIVEIGGWAYQGIDAETMLAAISNRNTSEQIAMSPTTNEYLMDIYDLALALGERCVYLDGANAPKVEPRYVRFLLRSGITYDVMWGWCKESSTVDASFIIGSVHALYESMVTIRRGHQKDAIALFENRYQEMMASGLDEDLRSVELAFYAALVSDEAGYNNRPMDCWKALSKAQRIYPPAVFSAVLSLGHSFSDIERWSDAGVDTETLMAALSERQDLLVVDGV